MPFIAGSAAAGGGAAVASAVAAPLAVGVLAGLAVLGIGYGLAQVWGALNNKSTAPPDYQPDSDTYENLGIARKPADGFSYIQAQGRSPERVPPGFSFGFPSDVVALSFARRYYVDQPWPGQTGWAYFVSGYNAAGEKVRGYAVTAEGGSGYLLFGEYYTLEYFKPFYRRSGEDWQELELEPIDASPNPARVALLAPDLAPEPAIAPPVVVPAPYTPPALPEAEPAVEPAPARPARPTIAPPVVQPAPVPPAPAPERSTPTTPAGQVQPAPQPPPARTPPTVHVINGTQIPANGPQATPQSMAQELGRIENKLAAMLDPKRAPTSDNPDRLGELLRTALNIYEILVGLTGEGSYTLSSPCELDANGDRIVQEVEYGAALSSVGLISNKLDALALLLQKHKDLKQPICRVTPSTGGQSVTVNFVQID